MRAAVLKKNQNKKENDKSKNVSFIQPEPDSDYSGDSYSSNNNNFGSIGPVKEDRSNIKGSRMKIDGVEGDYSGHISGNGSGVFDTVN